MPIAVAWPPLRWVPRATALVIAVCAVRALWLLSGAWYVSDDMVNLSYARGAPLDGSSLSRSVFGEFEPGLRFINWVVARTSPVERWPAEVIELVAFVAVLVLLTQIVHRLAGPTWWTPVLVGMVGWSIAATATVVWWSSALTYVVASAFGLLAVRAVLDYAVGGGRHRPVVAVVALAACVSLYPGAAVFPFFAALVWALFRPDGPGLRGAVRSLVTRWRLWVLLAVPLALVAVATWAGPYETGAVAAPRALVSFVWVSWSETIAPSLFGLPPQFLSHRVVSEELAVLVVAVTVVGWRGAWRAWVAVALPALVVLVAHGAARLADLGPAIELIHSDFLPIELLAATVVPLAFGRSAGGFTRVGATPRGWLLRGYAGHTDVVVVATVVATVAVLAGYAVLVTVATSEIPEVQQARLARAYVAGFTRTWDVVHRTRPDAVVADSILPYPLSISTEPDLMYPFDTAALDLGMFVPGARFAMLWQHPGLSYAATFPSGRLRPARTVPGPAVTLPVQSTGSVRVRSTAGPGVCLSTGSAPGSTWFPVAVESLGDLLSLETRVSYQPFVDLVVSRASGGSATLGSAGTLRIGHQHLAVATVQPLPALVVSLPARSTVCLRSVSLSFVGT